MNPYKSYSVALPLMLVTLLLLFGCGEPEPINIGFVGELSGRRSEIGVSVRNAVQLKVDQINAAGGIQGRPILLTSRDNMGETEQTEAIIDQMITDGIQFIVGPLLSQQAVAAAEAVSNREVLLISPTMSTDFLTGKDDNILRTASTTTKQGIQIAEYAQKLKAREYAVVYDLSNQRYTEMLYRAFETKAKSLGLDVTLALTIDNTNQQEMLPLARKIIEAKADGVLMCLAAVDAANLAQQLRKLGSDATFLGVSWAQTEDLILHGGRAVEGMVLVATRNYGEANPVEEQFTADYLTRYKSQPSFAGAKGYDAMGLLAQGMEEAKSLNPAAVKQAVLAIRNYPGAEKDITLDEYGDTLRGYSFVTVKDGRYVHVE